jgi:hypothetical protein
MSAVTAQVHVPAAEVSVVFHCEHDDDRASFRLEHDANVVTVYLTGTVDELSEMACKLSAAVAEWAIRQVEQATTSVRT